MRMFFLTSEKMKRAQVASTLTWVPSLAIISFILFALFLIPVFILTMPGYLPKWFGGGFNQININSIETSIDANALEELIKALNFPVHERQTLKDKIIEWKILDRDLSDKELEEFAKEALEKLREEEKCHIMRIGYDGVNDEDFVTASNGVNVASMPLSSKIHKVLIFAGKEKINVEMSVVEKCL